MTVEIQGDYYADNVLDRSDDRDEETKWRWSSRHVWTCSPTLKLSVIKSDHYSVVTGLRTSLIQPQAGVGVDHTGGNTRFKNSEMDLVIEAVNERPV